MGYVIKIFGVDVPIIAIITGVSVLIPILLVSFSVTDVEYLTQDQLTHKTRKLVFSVLFFLMYLIFIVMLDYSMASSVDVDNPDEIRCYLDYLDTGHVMGNGEVLFIFFILYALILIYIGTRSNKINSLPIRLERMKLEKKVAKKYDLYTEITWLLDAVQGNDFPLIHIEWLFWSKFCRFIEPHIRPFRKFFRYVATTIFDTYRKGFSYLIGVAGPLVVIVAFSEMSFYKHISLFITLLFTINLINEFVSIHFDDEINFCLDEVFLSLFDYRKEYTHELIWVTNSKRHSIYKTEQKNKFILVHRDNGTVEVAKRMDKFYNRIVNEKRLIKENEFELDDLKCSIQQIREVVQEMLNEIE